MSVRADSADWYEVYDHEGVQLVTRRRVSRLLAVSGGVLLGGVLALPMAVQFAPSPWLGAGALLAVALGVLVLVTGRLLRLRRVVWCVKLSVHRIVGYDYARRKLMLPWTQVERVDVEEDGLLVVGAPGAGGGSVVLHIPVLFPDYPRLSHRVVEYAEAHGVPVCLEGRPLPLVSLGTLYPFMASVPVLEASSGPGSEGGAG